jgi:hypothetical protein
MSLSSTDTVCCYIYAAVEYSGYLQISVLSLLKYYALN